MKVVLWGIVVVTLGYLAYAGMMSAWQWLEIENVVDEALQPRNATDVLTVKNNIVKDANAAGVPLTDRDVFVTASDRALLVHVAWTYPVILVRGEKVLAVPLSVKRTKEGFSVAR